MKSNKTTRGVAKRLRRTAMSCAAALLVSAASVLAAYPEKPIRMIIPYSPGGATDVVIRIWAEKLPELIGQQVVIDNRPGAGSLIGTEIAAKSPADGYTLLGSGSPLVIVPHLYKKLPYDPLKDFMPIMQVGSQPYALTVHPSLGVKTVQELIDLAKREPGKVNYASSGNGGAQHLFAAMFVSMAKINMVHIPYKGSGPARADLLGGQVKVGCLGISSVINFHKAGQLRMIGLTGAKRSPELPDIPTIGETIPGYEASLWSGVLAPRGTPPAVISYLNREIAKLLLRPDIRLAFKRTGTEVVSTNPKAYGELLRKEYKKWGDVVREVKLRIG
jgi:tripartite-type tricarboxylate transporter receptor subunit TctC